MMSNHSHLRIMSALCLEYLLFCRQMIRIFFHFVSILFLPLHFDEQITWSVKFHSLQPLGRFDDVIGQKATIESLIEGFPVTLNPPFRPPFHLWIDPIDCAVVVVLMVQSRGKSNLNLFFATHRVEEVINFTVTIAWSYLRRRSASRGVPDTALLRQY